MKAELLVSKEKPQPYFEDAADEQVWSNRSPRGAVRDPMGVATLGKMIEIS